MQEFWARYAEKGAVGLVGGTLWIHRAICEAPVHLTPDRRLTTATNVEVN